MVITRIEGIDVLEEFLKVRQKKRINLSDFIKRLKNKKKKNG